MYYGFIIQFKGALLYRIKISWSNYSLTCSFFWQVYIIDYGLAKKYRDLQTHKHIPYRFANSTHLNSWIHFANNCIRICFYFPAKSAWSYVLNDNEASTVLAVVLWWHDAHFNMQREQEPHWNCTICKCQYTPWRWWVSDIVWLITRVGFCLTLDFTCMQSKAGEMI